MPPPQSVKAGASRPTQRAHGPVSGIRVTGIPAGEALSGQACYVMGWAVRNTSSSALAAFSLYDGLDATAEKRFPVNLSWNETDREWFGPDGVWMDVGVFYVLEAGAVEGSVLVAYPELAALGD